MTGSFEHSPPLITQVKLHWILKALQASCFFFTHVFLSLPLFYIFPKHPKKKTTTPPTQKAPPKKLGKKHLKLYTPPNPTTFSKCQAPKKPFPNSPSKPPVKRQPLHRTVNQGGREFYIHQSQETQKWHGLNGWVAVFWTTGQLPKQEPEIIHDFTTNGLLE